MLFVSKMLMYLLALSVRSEDDYSEEEEEEEYDGEIPQPELEPRSRRCLVGDAGVCVIPGVNNNSSEDEDEEDEGGENDMHGEDSDSDGPVLYKDEDSDEEDEPPLSKHNYINEKYIFVFLVFQLL